MWGVMYINMLGHIARLHHQKNNPPALPLSVHETNNLIRSTSINQQSLTSKVPELGRL